LRERLHLRSCVLEGGFRLSRIGANLVGPLEALLRACQHSLHDGVQAAEG
jgi:hypothetical protein